MHTGKTSPKVPFELGLFWAAINYLGVLAFLGLPPCVQMALFSTFPAILFNSANKCMSKVFEDFYVLKAKLFENPDGEFSNEFQWFLAEKQICLKKFKPQK